MYDWYKDKVTVSSINNKYTTHFMLLNFIMFIQPYFLRIILNKYCFLFTSVSLTQHTVMGQSLGDVGSADGVYQCRNFSLLTIICYIHTLKCSSSLRNQTQNLKARTPAPLPLHISRSKARVVTFLNN